METIVIPVPATPLQLAFLALAWITHLWLVGFVVALHLRQRIARLEHQLRQDFIDRLQAQRRA